LILPLRKRAGVTAVIRNLKRMMLTVHSTFLLTSELILRTKTPKKSLENLRYLRMVHRRSTASGALIMMTLSLTQHLPRQKPSYASSPVFSRESPVIIFTLIMLSVRLRMRKKKTKTNYLQMR